MALFTDTVTIYQKQADGSHKRTVVPGVQWSDLVDKTIYAGRLTVQKSASVTLPAPAFNAVNLETFTEEDAVFLGNLAEEITDAKGGRLSDLIKKYPKGGIIRAVNDNRNRDKLKNVKVVVY